MRRLRAVGVLALLFALVPSTGAHAADELGGYQTSGSGVVFSAFPTLPAFTVVQAPVEGTVALSTANLAAGGQAFARSSITWPGDVLGGLGSLLKQAAPLPVAVPNWPIRAEAHEYTGPSSDSSIPGIRMQAFGSPAKSEALADVGALILPDILTIASSSSHTVSTQGPDKAGTTVDVSVHGINIAAGQVVIDTFKATSATASDGVKPTGKGTAVIAGLVIGGTPASIDASGIHASGQGAPGTDPNKQINDALAASGIHLALTPSDVHIDGGTAQASAPALLITIPTPNIGPLPAGFLTIELGATHAQSAASPGIDVSGDLTDVGAPLGQVLGSSLTSGDTGSSAGTLPDLSAGGGSALTSTTGAGSSIRPQVAVNASNTEEAPYNFKGLSGRLWLVMLVLAFVGVLLIRRYMRRLLSIGRQ
ncbi:MAG: hypothetical protein JOZ37_21140 [Actinobacteria bacterium]|nr:hypothetical protein [Actinomycetota bacterium]MBV9934097.1 hypothetical protein [Actinomycetota bacterium]